MEPPSGPPLSAGRIVLGILLGGLGVFQFAFTALLCVMWSQGDDPGMPMRGKVAVTLSSLWMAGFLWFGSRRAMGDRRPVYVVGNRVFMIAWALAFSLISVASWLILILKNPVASLIVAGLAGLVGLIAHFRRKP